MASQSLDIVCLLFFSMYVGMQHFTLYLLKFVLTSDLSVVVILVVDILNPVLYGKGGLFYLFLLSSNTYLCYPPWSVMCITLFRLLYLHYFLRIILFTLLCLHYFIYITLFTFLCFHYFI